MPGFVYTWNEEMEMPEIKEIIEDENKIDTVISEDIELRGRLNFKNSLKIKGFFEGKIESDGHLIVGQEASVSADIKAGMISIHGAVNGQVKAGQRIELYKESKTRGDMITPDLYVERGSSFNGSCVMNEKDK
jgi:cytoskeletal protein CcmA (bactofilin family)